MAARRFTVMNFQFFVYESIEEDERFLNFVQQDRLDFVSCIGNVDVVYRKTWTLNIRFDDEKVDLHGVFVESFSSGTDVLAFQPIKVWKYDFIFTFIPTRQLYTRWQQLLLKFSPSYYLYVIEVVNKIEPLEKYRHDFMS